MWLEAKKRVEYPRVPEIMIDDWFNKGHKNLNTISVVGEQIRSLSIKQSRTQKVPSKKPKGNVYLQKKISLQASIHWRDQTYTALPKNPNRYRQRNQKGMSRCNKANSTSCPYNKEGKGIKINEEPWTINRKLDCNS